VHSFLFLITTATTLHSAFLKENALL